MQGQFATPDTHKYSVILPTYNERKNLPVIVWLLAKVFQEECVRLAFTALSHNVDSCLGIRNLAWEIIVVDDASPDGTQEIARQLAGVYGEDKIVSYMRYKDAFYLLKHGTGAETPFWEAGARVRFMSEWK